MQAPDVHLPTGQSRCLPKAHCAQATVCARWLAPARPGVPVTDYTTHGLFLQGKCLHHLPASEYRKAPAAPAPTVHEAPAGLR